MLNYDFAILSSTLILPILQHQTPIFRLIAGVNAALMTVPALSSGHGVYHV